MKVLQLSHRLPYPLKDGGAIAIYNVAKGFREAGCEVTLLAMNTLKHHVDVAKLPPGFSSTYRLFAVDVDTGVKALDAFLNLFGKSSYNVQRFNSAEFRAQLIKILQQEDYDLVQFEGIYTAMYADTVRAHSRAKLSLRQHNAEYRIWERLAETETSFLKKKYLSLLAARLRTFEASVLNKFDAVVPISEEDGETFREMGCTRPIFVSPAGVDMERYKVTPGLPLPLKLFHIGSMEWMPNRQAIRWFIDEIWELVHNRHPEIKLLLAGRNMPAEFLSMRKEGVEISGEVENALDFMRQGSVMIVPLLSGSGIRIKIQEAMALGKPVISTSAGAAGLKCENGRNILLADTPQEFAEAVHRLATDDQFANTLGLNGRKLIEEEYSNSAVVKKLLQFYGALNA
jgi:glycosyltransferase involved in cell wall biosynthesis